MRLITDILSLAEVTITFTVPTLFAPAFRSAVEDMSNQIGQRLEGTHSNQKTKALTDAAIGFGRLRAATCRAVPVQNLAYDLP